MFALGLQRYSVAVALTSRNPILASTVASRGFAAAPGASNNSKLVKQLRDLTGSPLKDCIKTLAETNGDIEKAKELLRKRGLADAEKRTGRATSEGFIGMKINKQQRLITFVELTCETDFVAKTDKFIQGVETLLDTIHSQTDLHIGQSQMDDLDYINQLSKQTKLIRPLDNEVSSQTIEEGIKYIISKTQENCKLNKVYQRTWNPEKGEILHSYVHNPARSTVDYSLGKIGSLVVRNHF